METLAVIIVLLTIHILIGISVIKFINYRDKKEREKQSK